MGGGVAKEVSEYKKLWVEPSGTSCLPHYAWEVVVTCLCDSTKPYVCGFVLFKKDIMVSQSLIS